MDITTISTLPIKKLLSIFKPYLKGNAPYLKKIKVNHPEKALAAIRISEDVVSRLSILIDLGLGYLSLDRSAPSLSPGELQRLRLATQVKSSLFGVVYILDEPSAGLHPSDTEALLRALKRLKEAGNSLFIVEHEVDVIHAADWIVDVGPEAGEFGGEIIYSGPPKGLLKIENSLTRLYLFGVNKIPNRETREAKEWLTLDNLSKNNIRNLSIKFPLGILTSVTGVSGSGKSTLVSQILVELISTELGSKISKEEDEGLELTADFDKNYTGTIRNWPKRIKRLVTVDQKAIGRTPRSNLATYTGLFDHVRKLFGKTQLAKSRNYDAGQFSFNVPKGRCENCKGEGFVMVELLFLPSVYSPCPACHGKRYNSQTLEVKFKGKNIADVLNLTVNQACIYFKDEALIARSLVMLQEVGLGYLRLGQPATELSGGEAQRIKLATELQRISNGDTVYILDEPTTGLHPADVEKLMTQLNKLVDAKNTVIVVEHDMRVISGSDWIIDMGPGPGDEGGLVVATGRPKDVIKIKKSLTAKYLFLYLKGNLNLV